jgi:hypothetical protein
VVVVSDSRGRAVGRALVRVSEGFSFLHFFTGQRGSTSFGTFRIYPTVTLLTVTQRHRTVHATLIQRNTII